MLIFVASFLITVFFMCAGRSTVHDLRERAEPIRTELNDARTEQRKQSETLEKAERATGASRERIADSKRFNQKITATERKNAEIIAECRNILKAVRERGSAQD